jgi:Flp pilus assembly protein TadG
MARHDRPGRSLGHGAVSHEGKIMRADRLRALWARDRSDDGAAAVEFAFVFPLIVLALFLIISIGQVYLSYQQLASGAREGARFAALTHSTVDATAEAGPGIVTKVLSVTGTAADGWVAGPTVTVERLAVISGNDTTVAQTGAQRPCAVTVGDAASTDLRVRLTVQGSARVSFPLVPGGSLPLTARAVFRCE